ncbi:hypothetical protein ACFFU9_13235 [Mariniflexile ostreae]|uniref:MORN repeat protein n=1 Tax=Mariniflexile ostreae TaxID=1520892 RepID=A0ABV5FE32_9FLAO
MRNLVGIAIFLLSVGVVAQQKPKEVKQETETKIIKINDGEKIIEKKVKVIIREEADILLNPDDENKTNQERLSSEAKVEKTVLVDHDDDYDYDSLTQVVYYKIGNDNYMFTPNKTGFDMASENDNNSFTKFGTAWFSSSKDHYIVNDKEHTGIGFFDTQGNLVVEYYNTDSQQIETKTYTIKQ